MLNFTIWWTTTMRQTEDEDSYKLKLRARHPDIPESQKIVDKMDNRAEHGVVLL